jgi:hypothetical protein
MIRSQQRKKRKERRGKKSQTKNAQHPTQTGKASKGWWLFDGNTHKHTHTPIV